MQPGLKTNPVGQETILDQSTRKVLQSRLINTVQHLLVKNNKGEGRGA